METQNETINALLESFDFNGETAGAEAEIEYVKVIDGDTWPVGSWEVDDLIEDGVEIRQEISLSIWSQSADMDSKRDAAIRAARQKVKELGLQIENEGEVFRHYRDEETSCEAVRMKIIQPTT
tara:strand:+ start:128 stop:496 length:369 start_codon:yes stop_codon:yes gene_type:complete